MAKLITRRWKNNTSNSTANGKYFQRVVLTETLSTDQFADHIVSHGSPYKRGTILNVLSDICECLVELTLDSKGVRLGDLGIFKMAVHATGAESPDKATPDMVQRVQLQFLPNQKKTFNLSSTTLRKKAQITGIDKLSEDVNDGFIPEEPEGEGDGE